MKKLYLILFAYILVLGVLSVTSCSKDNPHQEMDTTFKSNDLELFQEYFVKTDSIGQFVQRFYGEPLDPTDTTKLTVPVDNLEEAQILFQNWCQCSDSIKATGHNMVYYPTDENGKKLGTITFSVAQGEEAKVADITFSPDINLKYVSHIVFIRRDSLPDEGQVSQYHFGDFVQKETFLDGVADWVCIREAVRGRKGLLIYVSNKTIYPQYGKYGFASEAEAIEVSRVMREDWDNFVTIFQQAKGNRLSDYYYWSDKTWGVPLISYKRKAIVLKTGVFDLWECWWRQPYLQYLQVETFDVK